MTENSAWQKVQLVYKVKRKVTYQSICRSQAQANAQHKPKLHEVEVDDSDIPFLGEIQGEGNSWTVQVGINNHVTRCKLDTGASVSVVCDSLAWL